MTYLTLFHGLIAIAAAIMVFEGLESLAAMSAKTHQGIRWGAIIRTAGATMLLLQCLSSIFSNPHRDTDDLLFVGSIVVTAAGYVIWHFSDRRASRRQEHQRRGHVG